jgi:hypothetical protein
VVRDDLYWVDVSSTSVSRYAYDSETRELFLKFNGGGVYRYEGVPEDVYLGLTEAKSKGSYAHHKIKVAGYNVELVES